MISSTRILELNVYTSHLSHMCYIPYLYHPSWSDHANNIWRKVHIMKLFIMQFLHPTVNSFLLGPNILLSTLFSNTLNLCSSLNMKHQVSNLHKTKGHTKTQITYSHRVCNCRPKNSFRQNLLLWLDMWHVTSLIATVYQILITEKWLHMSTYYLSLCKPQISIFFKDR
jgi:hypothetical protein